MSLRSIRSGKRGLEKDPNCSIELSCLSMNVEFKSSFKKASIPHFPLSTKPASNSKSKNKMRDTKRNLDPTRWLSLPQLKTPTLNLSLNFSTPIIMNIFLLRLSKLMSSRRFLVQKAPNLLFQLKSSKRRKLLCLEIKNFCKCLK